MNPRRKSSLPHNWRMEVVKRLAAQGITLTTQQVYDVYRGRNSQHELVEKVATAVKEIRKAYQKKQRRLQQLQQIAA